MNGSHLTPDDVWRTKGEKLIQLPENSRIKIVTEDYIRGTINSGGELFSRDGYRIVRNEDYENALLELSFEKKKPIEVGMFRWIAANGEVISTIQRRYIGDSNGISSAVVAMSLNSIRMNRCNGCILEFTHVHPVVEYEIVDQGILNEHPLSPEDLQVVALISREIGTVVRMRAVVPNGYTYEVDAVGSSIKHVGAPTNKPPSVVENLVKLNSEILALKDQVNSLKGKVIAKPESMKAAGLAGIRKFIQDGLPGLKVDNYFDWLATVKETLDRDPISEAQAAELVGEFKAAVRKNSDLTSREKELARSFKREIDSTMP